MILHEQQTAAKSIKHYLSILKFSDGLIRPNFFLIGETGSGKTHTIRTVVDELNLDYIEVNAASITREGHSGNSLTKALGQLKFTQHKPTVVFIDEFDKTILGSSGYAHDSTADLQYEFLKLLEDGTVDLFADYGKYVTATVSKCLFVFGGTFNGAHITDLEELRKYGVRSELLGRCGQLVSTSPAKLDSLIAMVEDHKLIANYLQLFPVSRDEAILDVQQLIDSKFDDSDIGVRLVDACIHEYFLGLDMAPMPIEPTKKTRQRSRLQN